jgi:hypothetical protein
MKTAIVGPGRRGLGSPHSGPYRTRPRRCGAAPRPARAPPPAPRCAPWVRSHRRVRNKGTECVRGGSSLPLRSAPLPSPPLPSAPLRSPPLPTAPLPSAPLPPPPPSSPPLLLSAHRVGCELVLQPLALPRMGGCPGRKPPFLAVTRSARPYKSATQHRFTVETVRARYYSPDRYFRRSASAPLRRLSGRSPPARGRGCG